MSENNSNFRLNGLNPLAYMGVNPRTPVPFFSRPQDPTSTDYANFILGTIWLNTANENIWMLVKKANFVSTWVQFSSGSSGTVISLTGDDSIPVLPLAGNIDVLGLPQAGSSVSFTGATANTLKLNVTDALANTIIGNSAGNTSISGDNNTALGFSALNALTLGSDNTAIGESSLAAVLTGSNNISIGQLSGDNYIGAESSNILIGNLGTAAESNTIRIGTQGSGAGEQNTAFMAGVAGVTVANPNFVTINTATGQLGSTTESPFATTFDGNTGSATPIAGILNIVGDGTTATTVASGNTVTITAIGGGTGTIGSLISTNGNTISTSSNTLWGAANGGQVTSKALAQSSMPVAGTINNLYVNVGSNGSTVDTTVTINKNGANTSLVATVPALTTGVFTDLVHSVSYAAGDTFQFEFSQGATASASGNATVEFNVAGGGGSGGNSVMCSSAQSTISFIQYAGINGNSAGATTSTANTVMTSAGTISKLYVNVTTNTSTSNDTISIYKNGSITALSAPITALTTGVFFDTINAVSIVAGDLICFGSSVSTTGQWLGNVSCNLNS